MATLNTETNLDETTRRIIDELTHSYWMEIETVQNYLANSVNLVGVRAEEIKKSLAGEVDEELGHARQLADRIHTIGGEVPGSAAFEPKQREIQPPDDPTDVAAVIRGVIIAEEAAIVQYKKIIEITDGIDYPTQDLCIALLKDEEEHRRQFIGFLTEYERNH